MSKTRAEDRRSPFPVRDGRAVIIRVLMPSRPLCAQARDVRPEREPDPDGAPGRGRYAAIRSL